MAVIGVTLRNHDAATSPVPDTILHHYRAKSWLGSATCTTGTTSLESLRGGPGATGTLRTTHYTLHTNPQAKKPATMPPTGPAVPLRHYSLVLTYF